MQGKKQQREILQSVKLTREYMTRIQNYANEYGMPAYCKFERKHANDQTTIWILFRSQDLNKFAPMFRACNIY